VLRKKTLGSTAWAVAVAGAVFACTSNIPYTPPTATFPYAVPSCSGNDYNGNCWLCVTEQCAMPAACIAPDAGECAGYFDCFCACNVGDMACQQACTTQQTAACTSCEVGLAACEATSCSAFCGNPKPPATDAGDSGSDGTVEAASDSGSDSGGDSTVEAATDAGGDGGTTDAASDAGVEGGLEAATEAGADAATDAQVVPDAGSDAATGADAGTESGADAGSD
jgi:hypothetical protein